MRSEIFTFPYPNGEIQKVQLVRFENWSELEYLSPEPSEKALDCFCDIYKTYLIPACPWVFGQMIMFRLPQDMQVPFPFESGSLGKVASPLTAAALGLKKGVVLKKNGSVKFRNRQAKKFWEELNERDCVRTVHGFLPITTVIPVSDLSGYLSETEPGAKMKVNGSFFIMDPFDCSTHYDHVGTPFGLFVKDGEVQSPPLFSREALLVHKDSKVEIKPLDIRSLKIKIGGETFVHGENAKIYTRPEKARSPHGKKAIVIIGNKVAAVSKKGVPIPCSGFVICPEGKFSAKPGDAVTYCGMEDISFGIQVGNSIIRSGKKTEEFISKFFNVRGLRRTAFPPSLYPLNFEKARAARIALGADKEGNPMLLWAEGAPKLGYTAGKDSCGASLSEMAEICSQLGFENAVNLDGGGSAQIMLGNLRCLSISDRNAQDYSESERPVPMGLVLR